jgi:molybdate transport system substrate-binding protein
MIEKLANLLIVMLVLGLAGCSLQGVEASAKDEGSPAGQPGTQTIAPQTVKQASSLTIFAAASLTSAFQEIGQAYEAANPGLVIHFNFAGSQILRTQIEQGAGADVFASADYKNMDVLISDNLVKSNISSDFVTNKLVVILPENNPANVQSLGDLARPNLKLVLADEAVPAGNYARQVLRNLSQDPGYGADFYPQVLANVVSNEADVKQVVAKVELGEADAGIAYLSDTIAAPGLQTITIPAEYNIVAHYPIAVLSGSSHPAQAAAFIIFVLSPIGQNILIKWGFSGVNP